MDLALDICERISSNSYVTHEDTLRANRVIQDINLAEINKLLDYFCVENMFPMLLTSEFKDMYQKLEKDCEQSTAIEGTFSDKIFSSR